MTPRETLLSEAAEAATEWFGRTVSPQSLRDRTKSDEVAQPRQYAAAYIRWKYGPRYSLSQLGRLFGYADHTTVVYGTAVAKKRWPDAVFNRAFPPHLTDLICKERARSFEALEQAA